ncbi:glycosyltransferase family 2 protein [Microbacterium sp. A196]|uniref:glycosyltransferase family 2 protein n=1 Tax=Microbacterium sp. A196 TaxID=3457320 RepID=UPI003FD2F620
MSEFDVAVVIPSVGRPELKRAIESVGQQSISDVQLIVVADMATDDPRAPAVRVAAAEAQVIFTGGGAGGARARNIGLAAASGTWVAFLDDDDYWTPDKLQKQLSAAVTNDATVISSRVAQVSSLSLASVASAVPSRLIARGEDPARYLFVRRRPGALRASLFTSTLLVRADLAKRVLWDESLPRHQDWDWILSLAKDPDFQVFHCPEVLVSIVVGSAGSISSGSNWRASISWAEQVLEPRDGRVFVDFVAAQTLRYALQARSWDGVRTCLRAITRARKVPSLGPVVIGAAGLLSRSGIESAMRIVR